MEIKAFWFMKYSPGLGAVPGACGRHCHYQRWLNERNSGHDFSILALTHVSLLSWDLNCGSLKTNFNHFNEFITWLLTEMSLMSMQGPQYILLL